MLASAMVPLIGVGLCALIATVLRIHEPEVGSLHLSLQPFVGFAWTPRDMTTVVPAGFGLAFAELGAYGIASLCTRVFGRR